MAGIGVALEKLILASAKAVATLQVGVNKVLWGSANKQPVASAKYDSKTGKVTYTTTRTTPTPPKKQTLINSGLFNALDALNRVDLCNIITYFLDNINIKKKPRPPRETWTGAQKAFYTLQDKALVVQIAIDKYTAFPTVFIGNYLGTGPDPLTMDQAVTGSGAPLGQTDISGTDVSKYNMYNLLQSIKDSFADRVNSALGGALTPEEKAIAAEVPGLTLNLNFVDNFIASISKYTDYREISNEDFVKLQDRINKLRAVCVVINTLDFKSALALAGNFLNVDVRAQIQELSKFVDPTKIIPTLKQINNAIRSFINIATRLQNLITQAQFVIKIAIIIIKVFKFIRAFFLALPLPSMFTTTGINIALNEAHNAAKETQKGLIKILNEVNALLSVILIFTRYLLANANELLTRLDRLLATLEGCEAVKDSDVIAELKQTRDALSALRDNLAAYITQYDSKTNPDSTEFGQYSIRVVDEEVVDRSITNKRRRGIALDQYGVIVTQSDLTFATNTQVIIGEVKVKLIAAGLVLPSLATLDGSDLAIISESVNYLDSNDLLDDNLNIEANFSSDTPDNEDESKGLGLNAFINNLPGGKRLRKRVRRQLASASEKLGSQIEGEKVQTSQITNTTSTINSLAG
jgi:hypothetical protein